MDRTAVGIEALSGSGFSAARSELVALLRDCVHGGASIGFLAPLGEEEAGAYWDSLLPQIESDARTILVAREGSRIVGTAQLAFESKANGRHRAEVNKVIVHPSHRRRGIAAQLMRALEAEAHARSIRLLYLDTSAGPTGAQAFYESVGYTYAGGIPEYALDPHGRPEKNAIYYKLLS